VTDTHAVDHPVEEHAHGSDMKYVVVALILGGLTAIEVALYYVDAGALNAPLLLSLALFKFVLVALYFMHLRYDNKFFTRVFFGGAVLAVAVYLAVLFSFHVWD
jgi:cytochrome c oxidase subunit 4